MTKFWVDAAGKLLRATDDSVTSFPGAVEAITVPPQSGRQIWNGTTWGPVPPRVIPPALRNAPPGENPIAALNVLKAHLRGA